MQQPTLQNVRIRSTRDALQVFHGVATRHLPLITRRLDAEERRNIVPGNVYVWEERGANTEPTGLGMERWTDGMGWGPSRVRDEFLFYHQKDSEMTDDLVNPVTPWAQMMRPPGRPNNRPFAVDVRPLPEAERLIKQTYSVHVSLPADRPRGIIRKWHLTAYFSPQKLDGLRTIADIPYVGDIVVPEGWFRSARIGRNRRDSRSHGSSIQPSEALNQTATPMTSNQHHSPTSHHRHPPSTILSISPTPSGYSSAASSSSIDIPNYSLSQLVPLEVLVRTSGPRRDPADEQLLRRFLS
ncbi:Gti1/Pac2 family-domain-containing protein [Crassisporium funariophilum]|nr:Gti1/Pac2 family-domain-containing protein [Crassisporium funariophilum]